MIQLILTLILTTKPILTKSNLSNNVPTNQGRIQGEAHPASNCGGRRENVWGISCEKSRFYAKKWYFFPILLNPPLRRVCMCVGSAQFF
jgi:hypothetical protein